MPTEFLTLFELLTPTLFVIGAIYLLGPILAASHGWGRGLLFICVWVLVGWYLDWRLLVTVLPADGTWYEVGWIWVCFSIELLSLFDVLILSMSFLRTTNWSPEADRHERRIQDGPADKLPWVDVFIPTYNEPIEVLEKTITGALSLDYPNFRVWVLDDGRRPWLKRYCEAKGAGYFNRPDNAHAKAGNINHALIQTSAEFVAIFDADFIPQRNFLARTIGFFEDPNIGIVQLPHAFYNPDPMQANLAVRKSLPDEQRFFFDVIMPSRDAWNAAFCCGSNSVTRRSALATIGGTLPTDSITEDILLSMVLLRKGYATRYLNEKLAFGLAPETIDAFFIQRQRWVRGALQMLYLANGPLGKGLTLMQRLLFLPTHWLSSGLRSMISILAPIVFLWTGLAPVSNVSASDVLYYFVPMVLALTGGIWAFAPGHQHPLASLVQSTFLSFRILPSIVGTLIKPFGHAFKVTPKGSTSQTSSYARDIFWAAAILIGLNVIGLVINSFPETRIIDDPNVLPVIAFWSAINVVVLFFVCMMSLQAPLRRGEERLELDEPVWIVSPNGSMAGGNTRDISISGAGVMLDGKRALAANVGDSIRIYILEVGFIAGNLVRSSGDFVGIKFVLPESVERDLLIRKLFTVGFEKSYIDISAWSSAAAMFKSIWGIRTEISSQDEPISDNVVAFPTEKLPARSLIILPRLEKTRLAEIGRARRFFAAHTVPLSITHHVVESSPKDSRHQRTRS